MAESEFHDLVSFGNLVQRRRTALGLSRSKLAQAVACSPVTIKKIERDERRPSQQIAELLADKLLIPAVERGRFIQMARGELAPALHAPAAERALSMPAFLRAPALPRTDVDFPFVARDAELARLQHHLDQALRGSGQVLFVTGEAGCGKSVLAQEFARRSQQSYPALVVATGQCNAYTGIGDPYLPFRTILDQLTGDIEFLAAAGPLHPDHLHRLWQSMPVTLQALIELGHDLFDTFIATQPLLNRLARYVYAGASGLAPLQQQIAALAAQRGSGMGEGGAQQQAIFEQYSRVMVMVARQMPLLLILDDLQWADVGSINLLFHLARQLAGSRILIAGIYRPTDVALGRNGERHPLEAVVNELQRHSGNSQIELDQRQGRNFVDALIDAQPNQLDDAFRDALFRRTEGHALFTVELLRGLQAQGGVIRDEQGQWVEGAHLQWSGLPARVEGIIKERLYRLPASLQECLKVASVEGEVFTAEIVAGVQGMDARGLSSQLSQVLERQQDLLRAVGSRRVGMDGPTISQYRFRHILFQHFLYEGLDAVERAYLHHAVGETMEQLYAGHTGEAALQLARHFELAGDVARALAYFVTAGDVAAAAYANPEAIAHYRRAIALAQQVSVARTTLIHLYTRLGRVLELTSQFDAALACYVELHALAQARGDRRMELSAVLAQSTLLITFTPLYDAVRGQSLLEGALHLARTVGDQTAEAEILWKLATLHMYAGRAAQAVVYGEQSLVLARGLDLREQIPHTLNDLGMSYFGVCDLPKAEVVMQEARERWRALGNVPMLADALSSACTVYLYAGEYEQAIAYSQEAYRISQAAGNLWGQAYSRNWVGNAYWQLGEPDAAIDAMEEGIDLADSAGFAVPLVLARADLARIFGALGAVERGLSLAHAALAVAEQQVQVFHFHVLSRLAQLYLWQDDLATAAEYIRRAKLEEQTRPPVFLLTTHLIEAELAWRQADYARVLTITDAVLATVRRFGIRLCLGQALYWRAQALLAMGQPTATQESLREAHAVALATGARIDLWPVSIAMSRLAPDLSAAEALRAEAQTTVEAIAARIPTADLKASFLALPPVHGIFARQ